MLVQLPFAISTGVRSRLVVVHAHLLNGGKRLAHKKRRQTYLICRASCFRAPGQQ